MKHQFAGGMWAAFLIADSLSIQHVFQYLGSKPNLIFFSRCCCGRKHLTGIGIFESNGRPIMWAFLKFPRHFRGKQSNNFDLEEVSSVFETLFYLAVH